MSLLKDLKAIKESNERIEATLCGKLEQKSKRADELEKYLSQFKLKLKSISPIINEDGTTDLKITYEAPSVILRFDETGEVIQNDLFKAINMLDLLDYDDLEKIVQAIESKKSLK